MTADELEAVRKRVWHDSKRYQTTDRAERALLLAEVDRLRALVKEAEFKAEGGHWDEAVCPWCDANSFRKHTPQCPAFTENGDVR